MKLTKKRIEKAFFEFINEQRRSPSRREIVDKLGTPGSELLKILDNHSKNLKCTWELDEDERRMLGELVLENDEFLHIMVGEISFLPVWSSQCIVTNRKVNRGK